MQALSGADAVRYQITILNEPGKFDKAALAHWQNGSNYDPTGKIDAFDAKIRSLDSDGKAFGESANIAFFKFCYVDFYHIDPDLTILFNHYVAVMEKLMADFPNCKFVHVTVPLFALIYNGEDEINIRRHTYNELLRAYIKEKGGFLFDLADLEAHDDNGVMQTFEYKGSTYPVIWYDASNKHNNGWTYDGGHLNTKGAEYMALALWRFLAAIVDGALPVELTAFQAKEINRQMELYWQTASEKNNFGFEVQRSGDGINFYPIAFVHGNGTTSEPCYYQYSDTNPPAKALSYRLKQIDLNGDFQYSFIINIILEKLVIKNFYLGQNYPNPFNPVTYIHYHLPESQFITLKIYDSQGRMVQTLFEGQQERGDYQIPFNAASLPSGHYFYELKSINLGKEVKKMLLIK